MLSRRRHVGLLATLALAVVALAPRAADACVNFYGTAVDGSAKRTGNGPHDLIYMLTDRSEHERRAQTPVPPTPPADATPEVRNDHAALLLYHGRAHEAVGLLEALERDHPGRAIVAANLGTAYELAGDDASALRWIQEGVRRDPREHEGTEWLHVRILEAKLARARDPGWLDRHSVLGVEFGDGPAPRLPATWPPGQDQRSTHTALAYQLHERLGFVTPPDAIVGDLLAAYADLTALELAIEHALPIYDLALTYQPIHANRIAARREHLARIPAKRRFDATMNLVVPIVGLVVAAIIAIALLRWLRARRSGAGRAAGPAR